MIFIADIKTKEIKNKTIKSIDKTKAWTERVKDPVVHLNDKVKDQAEGNNTITEYGEDKIRYYSNRAKDESIYASSKMKNKAIDKVRNDFKKRKLNKTEKIVKEANQNIKGSKKAIKTSKETIKMGEKAAKETAKASKKMIEQGRKLAIETTKKAVKTTKALVKITVSSIKAIIKAFSSLIGALVAGGSVAAIIIIIICLVALLLVSVFGIFFANESGSRTMTSVISEVNQEVYKKIETEQMFSHADQIVMDSTYSNWKDVIAVYSVKYSNSDSKDSSIALYLNESNVSRLKNIFYDFNKITTSIKQEQVEEKINDYLEGEKTRTVSKKVLHVSVTSQTLDSIMNKYGFKEDQKKQVKELLDKEYDELWTSLIYGPGAGEYVYWRQKGASWSNIKIGTSGKSIGDIGCLATSIAILIRRSGANTTIIPFDPGVFVEEMNKNGGFDRDGNLQYSQISKIVPNFEYVGRVDLSKENKFDKLKLINEYSSKGYFLSVEVKGDTGQHWVAIMNIEGSNINMVDPGSDGTNMWASYDWKNTSQFVYFKIK